MRLDAAKIGVNIDLFSGAVLHSPFGVGVPSRIVILYLAVCYDGNIVFLRFVQAFIQKIALSEAGAFPCYSGIIVGEFMIFHENDKVFGICPEKIFNYLFSGCL